MNSLRRIALRVAPVLLALASPVLAQDDGHAAKTFWLPARASSDKLPVEIDRLFNLILWITGVTMVGVFAVLAFFLVKYRARPDRKAFYTHGSHKVEILWTIAPALILLWLALIQANTWLDIKAPARMPRPADATYVRVFAQQFQWNFRNAGLNGRFESFDEEKFDEDYAEWRKAADAEAKRVSEALAAIAKNGGDPKSVKSRLPKPKAPKGAGASEDEEEEEIENPILRPNALAEEYWSKHDDDDVVTSGEMVVPVDRPVLLDLRSVDVIHSYYLPHFRLKQDAVPGKPMPVWFRPTQTGSFEIACAELCGNNHTTMKAILRVVTREEYDKYLAEKSAKGEGAVNRRGTSQDIWRAWAAQDQNVAAARLR